MSEMGYGLPGGGMLRTSYALLDNAAEGNGPAVDVIGGRYIWACDGVFQGATVTLQYLNLNGTQWMEVKSTDYLAPLTMTEPGTIELDGVGEGAFLRCNVTGAGVNTSITSTIAGY